MNDARRSATNGGDACRPMIQRRFVGTLVYIGLVLLAIMWMPWPLCAQESITPTPAPTQVEATTAVELPTDEPTSTIAPEILPVEPTPTSTPQPVTFTPQPTLVSGKQTSSTPEPTATLSSGATPTATSTETAAPPATATHTPQPRIAYLAVLVSESVVPVGGTASSEVLVHLQNAQPGIVGLRLALRFDPQVVRVQDTDGNATNGVQVALAAFFEGPQTTVENQVDNARGEIVLALAQAEGAPLEQTTSWRKVATIVWAGERAGNSAITVSEQSRFMSTTGQLVPNALNHGTVFVRQPGQISGRVTLQGRAEHGNTLVRGSLAVSRVDRTYTALDGSFTLTASHGEGFYTVSAFAPGYLTAQSSRPIKLTVGSEVVIGAVTLLGGDVNGDNQIDIRDLAFVAYHLAEPDVQSDINGDGTVDILDLTLIASNFGTIGPTTWPISD